ncbi:hypothetical protein MKEN_00564600 [Mycena kentingensis (nom. inval.)]|nr:hypothetical protein MKEN_00564600 [Mycena kentingensis (nom. inval.)]
MLWIPTAKTTRSGRIFASFLQTTTFSIHGPLALAVSAESDKQQDHETDDDLDALDELPPEPNLLDDLDEPLPDPLPQPRKRKRSLPPDFTLPPPPKGPQSGAHRRRQRKREEKTAREGHQARTSDVHQLVSLPAANGAWVATGESAGEVRGGKKPRTVMDFLKMGFTNVCWDGKKAEPPAPLVDKHGRVFAVLAGQPDGQHYADAVRRMYDAMVRASAEARFRSDFKKHRRGLYAAVTVGFSYGQGQTVPGWLQRPHCEVGEALLENPDVQKVASFASEALEIVKMSSYNTRENTRIAIAQYRALRTEEFAKGRAARRTEQALEEQEIIDEKRRIAIEKYRASHRAELRAQSIAGAQAMRLALKEQDHNALV